MFTIGTIQISFEKNNGGNMKKKTVIALIGTGVFVLGAAPVLAQDVTIVGPPCTFNVRTTREPVVEENPQEGGEETELEAATEADAGEIEIIQKEVETFRLFGQAGDDLMLIRTDGGDEYILKTELQDLLPELDLDRFPNTDEIQTFGQGAYSEEVKSVQQALADLGYLTGSVDGVYGGGTADAVRRFQEDRGLEASGNVDLYTMLLITAINDGLEETIEVSSKPYEFPEEKFPQIAGKTEADLTAFMESKWRYSYDPFTQQGEINPSIPLGSFSVEAPAIDRIEGKLAIKVLISKDAETGSFVLVPAIVTETTGAYRPYVQGAILVGDDTAHLEEATSTGEIDGISMKETGCIPLTTEAMQLLATGSVNTIRLLGKNNTYDITIEETSPTMAPFMEACQTLA